MHVTSQGPELFATQTPIFITHYLSRIWKIKRLKNCTSMAQFNTELLSIIRPVKNSTFRVFDITGIQLLIINKLKCAAKRAGWIWQQLSVGIPFAVFIMNKAGIVIWNLFAEKMQFFCFLAQKFE